MQYAMRVHHVQTANEKDARKKRFTSTLSICEQQPCGMHNAQNAQNAHRTFNKANEKKESKEKINKFIFTV